MKPGSRTSISLLILGLPFTAAANELATITVEGTRMVRSLADTPAAVTVVDAQQVQQGRQNLQLDESLARVPGLYLQNRYNFAQGQRISIRGFGARAPFGVRGLRILLDGFPETLPDGQSQLDSIDLDSVSTSTVVRGPASVLYGNATGGVIDLRTLSGQTLDHNGELRFSAGNDGLRKTHLHGGGSSGQAHYYLGATHTEYEGYREQSESEKKQLNGRLGWSFNDHQQLELFLSAMDTPYAQDPGGLTRQQVHRDRGQASFMASRLNAGQRVDQQKVGVRFTDHDLAAGNLQLQAFISQRDFEQQLPFPGSSLIDYERLFYGVGIQYSNGVELFGLAHRYLLGADVDQQEDDRGRRSVNASGMVTGITAAEDQQALGSGIYLQTDTDLTETFTLSLGARADRIRLETDDRLLADGDDSGKRTFSRGSYSAGINWQLAANQALYGSVSSAYETPTFTELANPSGAGGFNQGIEPQKARNHEIGLRGMVGQRLLYDLSLFHVDVKDEITPYEIGGRTFYENAARTRREGVELNLEHFTTDTLTTTLAWTWADYSFDQFYDQQQNEDVTGNRMPGIPQHIVFAELAWKPAGGLYMVGDLRHASAVYAENTNETRLGGHTVVNARIGKQWRIGQQQIEIYSGVDNLFNKEYYSNIRINANSDRPVAQRGYFEPAPDRTAYAGVALQW